jgi:hypothetical protein
MNVDLVGLYSFQVDLKDDHPTTPKQRTYSLMFEVTKYNPQQLAQIERNKSRFKRMVRVIPIRVDRDGVLTIKFDQAVFYPGKTQVVLA